MRKAKKYTIACCVCDRRFESSRPWSRYCSQACAFEAKRRAYWTRQDLEPVTIPTSSTCRVCGAEIAPRRLRRHAHYCGAACRRQAEQQA